MRLRLVLPDRIEADREVDRVAAEGLHGQFTLLPRHVDGVVALVPGLLSFRAGDEETYYSIRAGTLIKCGSEVLVSVIAAVPGPRLEDLEPALELAQRSSADAESQARSALTRIEGNLMQRFAELEERSARG